MEKSNKNSHKWRNVWDYWTQRWCLSSSLQHSYAVIFAKWKMSWKMLYVIKGIPRPPSELANTWQILWLESSYNLSETQVWLLESGYTWPVSELKLPLPPRFWADRWLKKDQCQAQKHESGALHAQCSAPAVMLRGQSKCLGTKFLLGRPRDRNVCQTQCISV